MFKLEFDLFQGRAGREEYIKSIFIFLGGTMLVLLVLTKFEFLSDFGILALVAISFFFCADASVRRLHDIGLSGLVLCIALVPIANLVLIFVLNHVKGEEGPNRYGPPPV